MDFNIEEIKREIQQKENELLALKSKLNQICPYSEDINKRSVEDLAQTLVCYKSDENPATYKDEYLSLIQFIHNCLEFHKHELTPILFPMFVHSYLELIYNRHFLEARIFYETFKNMQEPYYKTDLIGISVVTSPEHLFNNPLVQTYRNTKSSLRMCKDSLARLKRFFAENKLTVLSKILTDHIIVDVFDGAMRTKAEIELTSGSVSVENIKEYNKGPMFYGPLTEYNMPLEDEEEDATFGDDDKPSKKKKTKKDTPSIKRPKVDPNSPAVGRIPLPGLRDSEKSEKSKALRELSKKVILGPESLPSSCFFTLLNAQQSATCVEFCEDSSMMSAGFCDSTIKIWSLNQESLVAMKRADDLEPLDKESDDIHDKMFDYKSGENCRVLHGHSGNVYSASFSPDKLHMVSCSEDSTVRLWSLLTWSNLVCYTARNCLPVWDAKFSPIGHYFATCGEDNNASLWSIEHCKALRMFHGHLSGVNCLEFHPNSNYLATGSGDRTIRVWDLLSGNCVRLMKGHKDNVQTIKFSGCGRYMASAGSDKQVMVWDLSSGDPVYCFKGHTKSVKCLAFSREDNVLASGGLDGTVKIWDTSKVSASGQESDQLVDVSSVPHNSHEIISYQTKSTLVLGLHFTRTNLLLGGGPYINTNR